LFGDFSGSFFGPIYYFQQHAQLRFRFVSGLFFRITLCFQQVPSFVF